MKKGYTYTLFTLLIVGSLITMITLQSSSQYTLEKPSKIRSDVILSTLNNVDKDLERSSYIATKRAILSLVDYAVTNGTFLNDTENAITETSITGIYNGTPQQIMENSTINDWTISIQDIMNKIGLSTTIALKDYTIRQIDLYDIELVTTYELDIFDSVSGIRVNKNITQNITIDYNSFEDPLNTVKSNLLFSTAMIPCNLTGTYGKALTSKTAATNWTVGKVFRSLDTAGISSLTGAQRAEKILVTINISKFTTSDINEFKGIIAETTDDDAGTTIPKIIDTGDAYSNTENTYLAAMSDEADRWINSIITEQGTTCFIEHDLGPTFFDRLEGNTTNGKYPGPGMATFIDPTILPKNPQKELDFIYWSQ
ncbi:MAG: hypothetical protein ABIG84_00435 [archaeon]